MGRPGRHLVGFVGFLTAGLLAGMWPTASASADPADWCEPAGLTGTTTVSTHLRIEARDLDLPKATSTTTVRVPQDWPLSIGLSASPDSEIRRLAMRCLLSYEPSDISWYESRDRTPAVSIGDGFVSFTDVVYGDVHFDEQNPVRVGSWSITTSSTPWRVELLRSPVLKMATFTQVRVELPDSWATGVFPWPPTVAGSHGATWERPAWDAEAPGVFVQPDTRILSTHLSHRDGWRWASDVLFWVFDAALLILLIVALRRVRRPGLTRPARRVARLILAVPVLTVAGYLGDDWIGDGPGTIPWHWFHYLTTALWSMTLIVAALLLWLPRLLVGFVTAVLLAVSGIAPLMMRDEPTQWGFRLAGAAALTLLACLGFGYAVQAALRGRLPQRLTTRTFLRSRSGRWSLLLAVPVTAAVLLQRYLDSGADWKRLRWVQSPIDSRMSVFGNDLATYVNDLVNWNYSLAYFLAAVLLVPLLRDLLTDDDLILPPGIRAVICLGYGLVCLPLGDAWAGWWFPFGLTVGLAGLFVLTGPVGRLNDPLWRALADVPHSVLVAEADRWRTVESRAVARERAVSAEGQATLGDGGRRTVPLIGRLHWLSRPAPVAEPEPAPDAPAVALPAGVTPLDALFAVGPYRSAFRNGVAGAVAATLIGLPATAWLLWADWTTSSWLRPADQMMLVTGLVGGVVLGVLNWTAGGFVLGVLWRRLPGRRGPTKSLALTAVSVLAFGADAALNALIGEPVDRLILLRSALTFAVLSLTSMSMDLRTVRQLGTAGFWPVRMLLIGYRMGNATAQATFALAQLASVLAIYSYVRSGGDAPPFPGIDPFSIGHRQGP
ncbi:DUF6185 family protein [Micromonospora chokoriensis]